MFKIAIGSVKYGTKIYTHPVTHSPNIIAQDSNNRFVTDTEKSIWNAKASTALATSVNDGLMSKEDKDFLTVLTQPAGIKRMLSGEAKLYDWGDRRACQVIIPIEINVEKSTLIFQGIAYYGKLTLDGITAPAVTFYGTAVAYMSPGKIHIGGGYAGTVDWQIIEFY